MEEEGEISSPFWLQSSTNRRRNHRRTSSLFLNSGVLLFSLCLAFSLFIFFILPPLLSLTPQIFKPKNLVKKSWDSVNVTLVLLALIFGFLSRNRNHDSSFESFDSKNRNEVKEKSNESTPRGWYGYTDRSDRTAVIGLRRTYSSYPNLREISLPEDYNDRWRFYDDTSLDSYRRSESIGRRMGSNDEKVALNEFAKSGIIESQRIVSAESDDRKASQAYEGTKNESQRFVTAKSDNRKCSPANDGLKVESHGFVSAEFDNRKANQGLKVESQCFVSAEPDNKKVNQAHESLKVESQRFVAARSTNMKASLSYEDILAEERVIRQVEPPPQPPTIRRRTRSTGNIEKMTDSAPPEQIRHRKTKRKDEKEEEIAFGLDTNEYYKLSPPSRSERKRVSGSENSTRNFLDSFRKKKKKQRKKSVENFEAVIKSLAQPPPPPPPPPPHNFFSFKKEKTTKFITVPPPPPPPPPPHKKTTTTSTTTTRKPQLPVKMSNFIDEAPTSGGDSPLHPIPPPPPPPPFKMPSWKFVVRGDYVKIGSISSSRSVSPDPDEVDSPMSTESGETPTAAEAADVAMFCPSPDVNSKADMFIAKFRAGLKLQKMNSMKQKQGVGLSNLGKSSIS